MAAIKYVVWQKYYDNGRVEAGIKELPADKIPPNSEGSNYDLYYDPFDTVEEAEAFKLEALEA